MPVVMLAADLAAALTLGGLGLCSLVLLPSGSVAGNNRPWRMAHGLASASAIAWALLSLLRALLDDAGRGEHLGAEGVAQGMGDFLSAQGQVHLVAVGLTAVVAVAAVAVNSMTGTALTALGALAALIPVALLGRPPGTFGHELASSAAWLHLTAVVAWVGGLGLLCLLDRVFGQELARAWVRLHSGAVWCFALLGVSGLASGWLALSRDTQDGAGEQAVFVVQAVIFVALGASLWAQHRRIRDGHSSRWQWSWPLVIGQLVLLLAMLSLLRFGPGPARGETLSGSPAERLTGHPLPAEPSVAAWLSQWRLDLVLGLVAVVAGGTYLVWVRRLHRRGEHWPAWRTGCWLLGCGLLGWLGNGGPAVYAPLLLSALLLSMSLLLVVAPLFLALGAPTDLALRALPRRDDGSRGWREWLVVLDASAPVRFMHHPLGAVSVVVASLLVLGTNPLLAVALSSELGGVVVVVYLALIGGLLADALLDPRRSSRGMRLAATGVLVACYAGLGAGLMTSNELLAGGHYGVLGLPWWVDAHLDQQIGGAMALAVAGIVTLGQLMTIVIHGRSQSPATPPRRQRTGRNSDPRLAAYDAGLQELARPRGEDSGEER